MKAAKILGLFLCLVSFVSCSPLSSENNKLRLIKTSEADPPTWLSEEQIFALIRSNVKFADVTDVQFPTILPARDQNSAIPDSIRYATTVFDLFPYLNSARMSAFVEQFSSYHNRYYQSATGVESQQWLLSQVQDTIDQEGQGYPGGSVNVEEFSHSWAQKSVIATIEGSDPDPLVRAERVVIGAHQDSINGLGSSLSAPGADDNAAGSVIVLEMFRVFLESGFVARRTLEFQFYAAEEVGLRGSAGIAQSYFDSGVNVSAMLNLDVPGYYAGRDEVAIVTDFVNPALTEFLRKVVAEYLEFKWTNDVCGYACSDHASFHGFGYPAAHGSEIVLHPGMHTVRDTFSSVDFRQVDQLAKMSLGFLVEIAEPFLMHK